MSWNVLFETSANYFSMKHGYLVLLLLIPYTGITQNHKKETLPKISTGMYSWKTPRQQQTKNLLTAKILEGSAFDMEYLAMSACALRPSKKKILLEVPPDEEYLFM